MTEVAKAALTGGCACQIRAYNGLTSRCGNSLADVAEGVRAEHGCMGRIACPSSVNDGAGELLGDMGVVRREVQTPRLLALQGTHHDQAAHCKGRNWSDVALGHTCGMASEALSALGR